jgi:hypothetical protein
VNSFLNINRKYCRIEPFEKNPSMKQKQLKMKALFKLSAPYLSIDNARVMYTKKSKFVKNEHVRHTFKGYER